MFSDFRFVTPTVLTARAASKVTDVYMYRFSRVSPLNRSTWGGAGHGDGIPYVFGHITTDDRSMKSRPDRVARDGRGLGAIREDRQPEWRSATGMASHRAPEYRLLDYGDDITVRSNADSPTIDFFQHITESLRRQPASPRP